MSTSLGGGAQLLILPNPGQPVDTAFSLGEVRLIAGRCEELGAVLAVDEAYYGFGAATCLPLVNEFENVIVLRTFSKAFGGAGLRVGYAIGNGAVIRALDGCRQSGEIAGPSLHAATVLMDHWDDYVMPGIAAVVDGRNWLRESLVMEGWRVRGTNANHVLIEMKDAEDAQLTAAALEKLGVRVRTNAPPVERHLLVTCGSEALMRKFHAAFTEATRGHARLH